MLTLLICFVILSILSYKKKKKRIATASVILIVLFSCVLTWGIYDNNQQRQRAAYREHVATYELKIYCNDTHNYSLLVPYLMDPNLQMKTKIAKGIGQLDYVKVNGTPMTLSQETLEVQGVGNLTVYGSAYLDSFPSMSMAGNSTHQRRDYWVYCEKTIANQNISMYLRCDQGSHGWISGTNVLNVQYIENGWNKIMIEYSNVEAY